MLQLVKVELILMTLFTVMMFESQQLKVVPHISQFNPLGGVEQPDSSSFTPLDINLITPTR